MMHLLYLDYQTRTSQGLLEVERIYCRALNALTVQRPCPSEGTKHPARFLGNLADSSSD